MLFSLAEVLESGSNLFPPALVPPKVLAELTSTLRPLPPLLLQAFLECRLDGAGARVDLSTLIPTDEGRRQLWALWQPPAPGPSTPRFEPDWRGVVAFVNEWVDTRSPLHRAVPFIWLEFDRDEVAARWNAPFPVFYLQPSHYKPERAPGETPYSSAIVSPEACKPLVVLALETARAAPLSPALKESIDRCLDALPEGGFLTYAAPLLSRGDDTVRLNVAVPARHLFHYLKAISWTGSLAGLQDLLRETGVPPGVPPETVWFDLDVGAGVVLPSIKVDYHYAEGDPRWVDLFDRLMALGLCAPDKREGALAWPGVSTLTLPGRQLPCRLQRGLTVKVTCTGSSLGAKAYLDFACRFALFE